MEHRQHQHEAVEFDDLEDLPAAFHVMEEVPLAQHGALGLACGAGGVDQYGEIVGSTVRNRPDKRGRGLGQGGKILDEPGLQPRVKRLDPVEIRPQIRLGDHQVDPGIGEEVHDFVGLQEGIDGDNHGTGMEAAEEGGHEFGTVAEPEPDAVARCQVW